jgi:hypothetical protein
MSKFDKILYAGLTQDLPKYLKRKVFPTNLISLLLLLGVATPFTIISLIYFGPLAIFPALGALVCIAVLIANFNGGLFYSRYVISLLPILLGAIYNAYLSNEGEQPLPALYLIELGFTMIPFVIFDLREKEALIGLTSICALIILTFPITNSWFVSDIDSSVIRNGWLASLTIGLAIISAVGCILGLAFLNKSAEKESEALIQLADEKNKFLELSEVTLKENIKKIEAAQEEEKKRNWATEGIGKVSEVLRANVDSQEIYDRIISLIVRYIEANQARFYIVDKEDEQVKIRLAACYAYERKKYINQEFVPTEAGLLGQAYLEGEYIYITEIPQNYVQITSGLGESTPSSLIIIPLKVNDIIEGIIELASFKTFQPYEIEFLEKTGESIASFIQGNRINEKTNKLLRQTLSQAELMQSQEEELRQNLEEMEAIHEETNRKEAKYIQLIEDLKGALRSENSNHPLLIQDQLLELA